MLEELRKLSLERGGLGYVADLDVRVVRVLFCVILVVVFCLVKGLQRHKLRDNVAVEDVLAIKLSDVSLGDLMLLL